MKTMIQMMEMMGIKVHSLVTKYPEISFVSFSSLLKPGIDRPGNGCKVMPGI
jgi:hypothetical protein